MKTSICYPKVIAWAIGILLVAGPVALAIAQSDKGIKAANVS